MKIRRGDIIRTDLNPTVGSEQGGIRPVVVLQNDVGNQYSRTTIVAPMTTRPKKKPLPTHVPIVWNGVPNTVLCEQIRVLSEERLIEIVGRLDAKQLRKLDKALLISLGIGDLLDNRNKKMDKEEEI